MTALNRAFSPHRANWAILVLWLVLAGFKSQADPLTVQFEAANKLYEEGRYTEAAQAYEKLLASGDASPAVWFNLGNAQFRSGQIGRAILAYRRAELLNPRDPDLRANLGFARKQVEGPTSKLGMRDRFLSRLTVNEWTGLAAGAVWIAFTLLTLMQFFPQVKRTLGYGLAGSVLLALVLGSLAVGSFQRLRSDRSAVVLDDKIAVRHGPFEESQAAFDVHSGAEMRVLDEKEDWLQISIGPRQAGWVQRKAVGMLQSR